MSTLSRCSFRASSCTAFTMRWRSRSANLLRCADVRVDLPVNAAAGSLARLNSSSVNAPLPPLIMALAFLRPLLIPSTIFTPSFFNSSSNDGVTVLSGMATSSPSISSAMCCATSLSGTMRTGRIHLERITLRFLSPLSWRFTGPAFHFVSPTGSFAPSA